MNKLQLFLIKILGLNIEEIKKYNEAKQKELDIVEFKNMEETMKNIVKIYGGDFLKALRAYTETGFPVRSYKKISDKYGLYEEYKYKEFMK